VVNVTNRANVAVRLTALKLFLAHLSSDASCIRGSTRPGFHRAPSIRSVMENQAQRRASAHGRQTRRKGRNYWVFTGVAAAAELVAASTFAGTLTGPLD
jgi:hypothetical protein